MAETIILISGDWSGSGHDNMQFVQQQLLSTFKPARKEKETCITEQNAC